MSGKRRVTSTLARLLRARRRYFQHKYPGLEVVNVSQPVGTPEAVLLEQPDRFAAPAFKRTQSSALERNL